MNEGDIKAFTLATMGDSEQEECEGVRFSDGRVTVNDYTYGKVYVLEDIDHLHIFCFWREVVLKWHEDFGKTQVGKLTIRLDLEIGETPETSEEETPMLFGKVVGYGC